jgi:uncharacterized protein YjbJ (UPF0337 family)
MLCVRSAAVRPSCESNPETKQEQHMNRDVIAGNWKQLKGQMQAKWGDLTNDDFDVAEGNANYLAGKLQERYGWEKDRAEKEVREFESALDDRYRH